MTDICPYIYKRHLIMIDRFIKNNLKVKKETIIRTYIMLCSKQELSEGFEVCYIYIYCKLQYFN